MKKDDASFFACGMNFGDISGIDTNPDKFEKESKMRDIDGVEPVLYSDILEEGLSPDVAKK
jgi:hypothetical protein